LEVRVDDRPPVTVDTSVPGPLEHGDRWTEVSTGGGVDSAHTVVIERGAGGTTSPQLGGVELRNGDEARGIHVIDAAHSGASAGLFAHGAGAVGDWVEATHASLVLLALGFNDWHDGVPPTVFRDDLRAVVDEARAADPLVPILLIAWPEATAAGYGGGFTWDEYVAAMASLAADTTDAALVDLSHLDVETTDGIHPSSRANRELADRLLPVLLGDTTYDPPP
jgi:lysophospholipase L1-like esterase